MNSDKNLVWIDCEMTGLDPSTDHILEIAVIITDSNLEPIDEPLSIVIQTPDAILRAMGTWCQTQHSKSGLIDEVRRSTTTIEQATQEVLAYTSYWCSPRTAPLCGNSVYQDRLFLSRWMPAVDQYLHYRIIDVSSVKELMLRWYPHKGMFFKKEDRHRALSDIQESIGELNHYKKHLQQVMCTQNDD